MSRKRPAPIAPEVVFGALADPTRRQVVELLCRAPRRASDLASELGASRPGMSRHLRVLRAAGVLRERSDELDARARLLTLDPAPLMVARAWLDATLDPWADQLTSFRALAESRAAEVASAKPQRKSAS